MTGTIVVGEALLIMSLAGQRLSFLAALAFVPGAAILKLAAVAYCLVILMPHAGCLAEGWTSSGRQAPKSPG